MPFDANGVYTPPAGAENATPGKIIQSAVWNAIFEDLSDALTQLGRQIIQGARIITTPGNITVGVNDSVILIRAEVDVINLPPSATKFGPVWIIGDAAGIFGTFPSVVTPNGSEKISGQNTLTLDGNYQTLNLLPQSGGYIAR